MTAADTAQEARLRRIAHLHGLHLAKSRRRDSSAPDFGRYRLVDVATNVVVAGADPGWPTFTLDDVENWLNEDDAAKREPPPEDSAHYV